MFTRSTSTALAALLFCSAGAGGLVPRIARADIYVVVHPDNPQRQLSRPEVVDIFMGRARHFSDGQTAIALDLPRDNPVHAAFYDALTAMTAPQLSSYWARMMIDGQTMPPQVLASEADVSRLVKNNPSAIGYLSLDREPMDKGLRIVFYVKEPK